MNKAVSMQSSEAPVETVLRAELARGDAVLGTIAPVLGHLLANHDYSLFSDEVVSRVRGMIRDIARQLLVAEGEARGEPDPRLQTDADEDSLTGLLLTENKLVLHCHALALEGQLTGRLERRSAIDPVLSPLLQALIASDDGATASIAMGALAAQARFVQCQRRMELPLGELSADLFDAVLARWLEIEGSTAEARIRAIEALRRGYDERAGRLGLLARLVAHMGAGSRAALSIAHGGVAMFLTALASSMRNGRDFAVVVTNDRQSTRLALSLRAAGLKPREVEEQFLHIHPELVLPEGFDMLRADRAASLLAASGRSMVA